MKSFNGKEKIKRKTLKFTFSLILFKSLITRYILFILFIALSFLQVLKGDGNTQLFIPSTISHITETQTKIKLIFFKLKQIIYASSFKLET